MSQMSPDDLDPTRPQDDPQGQADNLIDHNLAPSDQPALAADKEPKATPDQPELMTGEGSDVVSYQSELTADEEQGALLSTEEMLPPEARGEVNGGPLGCCLGVTVGLFLSLTVAVLSRFYSDPLSALFQQNYGLMGVLIRILMGVLAIVLAIFCGRIGWQLGKRFYREYEAPPARMSKRRLKSQKHNT